MRFCVLVEDCPITRAFFDERARFLREEKRLDKNPYTSHVVQVREGPEAAYLFLLEPVFPRIYWLGFAFLGFSLALSGFRWTWWHLPGFIMAATLLLFKPPLYFLGCRAGLRKAGYHGFCSYVRDNKYLTPAANRAIEGK